MSTPAVAAVILGFFLASLALVALIVTITDRHRGKTGGRRDRAEASPGRMPPRPTEAERPPEAEEQPQHEAAKTH